MSSASKRQRQLHFFEIQAEKILDLLKGKQISDCCLTGGEPTLVGDRFFSLLRRCTSEHPEAFITVLSNGKLFSSRDFTRRLSGISPEKCMFCISLHSEVDILHDDIVGACGSCSETQQGIYNLASVGFSVEIRIVISQYNYKYLVQFAEHIYNYFHFARIVHLWDWSCTVMRQSEHRNWMSFPLEYGAYLRDAVLTLHRRGIPVSVYNIPLCMCPPEIRKFSAKSISSWKNVWINKCNVCVEKEHCCGFFSTSISIHEELVKPFTERIEE